MEINESQVANVAPPVEKVEDPAMELPTAQAQPKPAGMLFESIGYQSAQDIPVFIDKMGINDAVMIILTVMGYAHKKGLFNLLESEVVSKAVRVFTAPRPAPVPPEEQIKQPAAQPVE